MPALILIAAWLLGGVLGGAQFSPGEIVVIAAAGVAIHVMSRNGERP